MHIFVQCKSFTHCWKVSDFYVLRWGEPAVMLNSMLKQLFQHHCCSCSLPCMHLDICVFPWTQQVVREITLNERHVCCCWCHWLWCSRLQIVSIAHPCNLYVQCKACTVIKHQWMKSLLNNVVWLGASTTWTYLQIPRLEKKRTQRTQFGWISNWYSSVACAQSFLSICLIVSAAQLFVQPGWSTLTFS